MEEEHNMVNISVIWRGKKLDVEINSGATLKEFGHKLQNLTSVKSDTLRLLIPRSLSNNSKLLNPFSDEHSSLSLQESSILEGKSIRMMGVFENEIEEVSQDGKKADLRIAGFDEEEKRLKQRTLYKPQHSLQLPHGPYIFCDFQTLHIPGVELNPPASEALRRMHMLAADPGIVAIMNKHRWRVGIMTEMAPVGYVGVDPKCLLGYNKNHGEEISLRLRTDDLKGFRKYESIKKTLLHELAHMVYSEHDANFYALDNQLNQEAATLDWTKSRSYSLGGHGHSDHYEDEEYYVETGSSSTSQRLGGNASDRLATARESSVAAAYKRMFNLSTNSLDVHEMHAEPDPDDSGFQVHLEPDPDDSRLEVHAEPDPDDSGFEVHAEPDPDDSVLKGKIRVVYPMEDTNKLDADRSDSHGVEAMETETYLGVNGNGILQENESLIGGILGPRTCDEPDPDDSEARDITLKREVIAEPDPDDSLVIQTMENKIQPKKTVQEPDPDDSITSEIVLVEPDPDDNKETPIEICNPQVEEPDPDDEELRRIQDPVAIVCTRFQKAIQMLKSQVNANEAASVIQTLFKIIRNVIEHPEEKKFQRLRKANPQFQKNIANYKAAMDVLFLVGFIEDVVSDEIGRLETYLVLKRNDPGLLWLAKSSLETCIVEKMIL